MSIEADYYENAEFWTDDMFVGQRPRFQAVLDLMPADARTLLDVGCGNGAFVHFIADAGRNFDRVHATDRSATALARVRAEKTPSSIDALPFKDREFDLATCLEVIEHLPLGIYEKGLENICRVADKYVLLGVPFEEDIEADLVRCPACTGKFNPDYHLRTYTEDTMNRLLQPYGFEPMAKVLTGEMKRYRFVSDWMDRRRRAARTGNPFDTAIPCPMCGFNLPPAPVPTNHGAIPPAPAATSSGGLKGLVKNLLHTGSSFGGIAMLYRRA
ncbi:MAG: class I SAM-dependent methyltransferase [Sphingomonas sp.]